jgi:hypothetical protein
MPTAWFLLDRGGTKSENAETACESARDVLSHEFGWELRLEVGDLFRTQVVRSPEEILTSQESWKAAMPEKGCHAPVSEDLLAAYDKAKVCT